MHQCIAAVSVQAHKLMLDLGVTPGNIFHLDLASNDEQTISAVKVALHSCHALVICTSAVPEPQIMATLLGGLGTWLASKMPFFGRQLPGTAHAEL